MSAKIEEKSLDEYIKADRSKKIKKTFNNSPPQPHKKHFKDSKPFQKNESNEDKKFPHPKGNKHETTAPSETNPAIFVSNLPSQINVDEVKTLFAQFGKIEKINLFWNFHRAKTCGAKIFYFDKNNCQKALNELNGAELDGQTLQIKFN